jgi:hypothetical protein
MHEITPLNIIVLTVDTRLSSSHKQEVFSYCEMRYFSIPEFIIHNYNKNIPVSRPGALNMQMGDIRYPKGICNYSILAEI